MKIIEIPLEGAPLFAGLSIVLVEDEFLITMDVEHMLRDFGCADTRIALSAIEGLGILHSGPCDLAILDWVLGRDSAHGLIEAAQAKNIAVVIMTVLGLRERDHLATYGYPVIHKPFSAEALAAAIRAALANRNPT